MIKALVLLEMCQAIKPISASLAVSITSTCEKQEMTTESNILKNLCLVLPACALALLRDCCKILGLHCARFNAVCKLLTLRF